jgi:hypothetical protein
MSFLAGAPQVIDMAGPSNSSIADIVSDDERYQVIERAARRLVVLARLAES